MSSLVSSSSIALLVISSFLCSFCRFITEGFRDVDCGMVLSDIDSIVPSSALPLLRLLLIHAYAVPTIVTATPPTETKVPIVDTKLPRPSRVEGTHVGAEKERSFEVEKGDVLVFWL